MAAQSLAQHTGVADTGRTAPMFVDTSDRRRGADRGASEPARCGGRQHASAGTSHPLASGGQRWPARSSWGRAAGSAVARGESASRMSSITRIASASRMTRVFRAYCRYVTELSPRLRLCVHNGDRYRCRSSDLRSLRRRLWGGLGHRLEQLDTRVIEEDAFHRTGPAVPAGEGLTLSPRLEGSA